MTVPFTETFAANLATSSMPASTIDIDVPPDVLAALLRRIATQWARLGETEPYWGVLTDDSLRLGSVQENTEAFYETGRLTADLLDAFERRSAAAVPRGSCLELGCGVGRITGHLARRFEHVTAVDISPGNLRICRERLAKEGLSNVDCVLIHEISDLDQLPEAEVFLSFVTLQHNSPPVQKAILSRVLPRITGGCLFQTLTNWKGYSFRAPDYLQYADVEMEMHALPQHVIFDLLSNAGLQIREVVSDGWVDHYGSNTFFAAKREYCQ